MEKLLLVDGSNLLFQMFFGMPARITGPDGRAIQGTLGFVGALQKIRAMVAPTHLAVLFDGQKASPRTALDPAYKANRPDFSTIAPEENPYTQLPDILRALDWLGLRHAQTTDCEADDWICSYLSLSAGRMPTVICSLDGDYFQLVSEEVSLLRYRGKRTELFTAEKVLQRFGVRPDQYVAFRALTGDSSDNIPGVKEIGPKTAARLLGQFETLEALLHHTGEIERPALRQAIEQNMQRIRKNDELIRLAGTRPLPFSLEELACKPGQQTTSEVLQAISLR